MTDEQRNEIIERLDREIRDITRNIAPTASNDAAFRQRNKLISDRNKLRDILNKVKGKVYNEYDEVNEMIDSIIGKPNKDKEVTLDEKDSRIEDEVVPVEAEKVVYDEVQNDEIAYEEEPESGNIVEPEDKKSKNEAFNGIPEDEKNKLLAALQWKIGLVTNSAYNSKKLTDRQNKLEESGNLRTIANVISNFNERYNNAKTPDERKKLEEKLQEVLPKARKIQEQMLLRREEVEKTYGLGPKEESKKTAKNKVKQHVENKAKQSEENRNNAEVGVGNRADTIGSSNVEKSNPPSEILPNKEEFEIGDGVEVPKGYIDHFFKNSKAEINKPNVDDKMEVKYDMNLGAYFLKSNNGDAPKLIDALDKEEKKINKSVKKELREKYNLSRKQLKGIDINVYRLLNGASNEVGEKYINDVLSRINGISAKEPSDRYSVNYDLRKSKDSKLGILDRFSIGRMAKNSETLGLATVDRKNVNKKRLAGAALGAAAAGAFALSTGAVKERNEEKKIAEAMETTKSDERKTILDDVTLQDNEPEGKATTVNNSYVEPETEPYVFPIDSVRIYEEPTTQNEKQEPNTIIGEYVKIESGALLTNSPTDVILDKYGKPLEGELGNNVQDDIEYLINGKCYVNDNGNTVECMKDANGMITNIRVNGETIEIEPTDDFDKAIANIDTDGYTVVNHVITHKDGNGSYKMVDYDGSAKDGDSSNVAMWVPDDACIVTRAIEKSPNGEKLIVDLVSMESSDYNEFINGLKDEVNDISTDYEQEEESQEQKEIGSNEIGR